MIKLTSLSDFTYSILKSLQNGTLIIDKHDPNNVLSPCGSFRTVVSHYVSSSMELLIKEGNYTVRSYEDLRYPTLAGYYELEFHPGAITEDIGYPIPSGSVITGSNYDRLIFYSGSIKDWHVAAETSSRIQQRVSDGSLILGSILT